MTRRNQRQVFRRVAKLGRLVIAREVDLFRYKKLARDPTCTNIPFTNSTKTLMIVSGRGMNIMFAQIWAYLSFFIRKTGFNVCVISRRRSFLNRYFEFVGLKVVYFDALLKKNDSALPGHLAEHLAKLKCFHDLRGMTVDRMPIGEIVMSTICRHRGVGTVEVLDPKTRNEINFWTNQIYKSYLAIQDIIQVQRITHSFHTEVFMEEYGGIYYGSLKMNVDVIRFAPTVRDNAFIVQKLNPENSRLHHASLDEHTWMNLKKSHFTPAMREQLNQNFHDRYSEKWLRAKRNHFQGSLMDENQVHAALGLSTKLPIGIIFSHILYDTIFFFGTDLYENYADWLVETVRIASRNDSVQWLVKLHPSNMWRGEIDTLLGGKTLEEQLLNRYFPALPPHIRLLPSDVPISPIALMKIADFGITVRGTAGLEMAALGKKVITCGTGRYENNGFTTDPRSIIDYEIELLQVHHNSEVSKGQQVLAQKYAYGVFILKPFELTCFKPTLSFTKKSVMASDDLCYLPLESYPSTAGIDVLEFLSFLTSSQRDLLRSSCHQTL
jgi:hypothetical protein